ncbi:MULTISPECIES: cytochrome P450 [Streptomyces]|uniref:Cytochrome P450 n=1 Tax=Streptomyces morookaense TaxID=1970 RepID=A0A7Y7EAJ7_STRMO|nr:MULTISPECIES: cytochrome P450 [Streptomyces]MCC2279914.1 cytochrome P450 [Streptomyces sp. ET3-23]NVK82173.1 cytochrome P450 [Streptomyces morookaense]GHF46419.1 cytochrome P450 [Streptomyces morookaense]
MTETDLRTGSPALDFPQDRTCPFQPPQEYTELREHGPLAKVRLFDGRPAWLVQGHAEGRALLADQRLSSDWGHPVFPVVVQRTEGRGGLAFPLIGVDDPEHARQRRMLIPSFGVKRMAAVRPMIQRDVDRLLDAMLEKGPTADLVSGFALPVPSLAICALLDVPYSDHDFFEERSRDFVGAKTSAEADAAFGQLYAYLHGLIQRKQAEPGDGLLDELIAVQLAEGALDLDELTMITLVLLVAGHETTVNAIALGALTLLQHPEQLEMLQRDPGMISQVVEELLRFTSVSDFMVRMAKEDIEVGGQTIKAGDAVLVSITLMNHDEASYEDPYTFDVRRNARHHVGFGHGIHQCLGQNLARAELEIALGSLFARIPGLKLAVPLDEVPIKAGHDAQGPIELPVTW